MCILYQIPVNIIIFFENKNKNKLLIAFTQIHQYYFPLITKINRSHFWNSCFNVHIGKLIPLRIIQQQPLKYEESTMCIVLCSAAQYIWWYHNPWDWYTFHLSFQTRKLNLSEVKQFTQGSEMKVIWELKVNNMNTENLFLNSNHSIFFLK